MKDRTDTSSENPNRPYCGNCGYSLEGLVDSSKCPECGRPLVEVLQRASHIVGRRYSSKTRIFGLPLIQFAYGPHGTEKFGHAKAILAFGDYATGWLAVGGFARGIFAFGGVALGVVSFGGVSVGLLLCLGGLALGGVANGGMCAGGYAGGGGAVGFVADGGMACGVYARGGLVKGQYIVTGARQDKEALEFFRAISINFNGQPIYGLTRIHFYIVLAAFLLALAMFLAVVIAARDKPHES